MSFDFADVPPPVNTRKDNEKDEKKLKNKEPIRKVNSPKKVKPNRTEGSKRMKSKLRIDMVGYGQKPIENRS
ncbi:5504_t:CDS:2 [Funneliformis mosseae]|uniref:5504_t:CDS:1 n=1 Tax=Funneliformis mosseae TaxID=27381 RepID=A0A9N9F3G4_FUNMO|nr:5504_t:CDS:2 [Funneliformis mosseae]